MLRVLVIILFVFTALRSSSQTLDNHDITLMDSVITYGRIDKDTYTTSQNNTNDSLTTIIPSKTKTPITKRIINGIGSLIHEFNNIDTAFIEPQHFKFTLMLQNTNNFEYYRLSGKDGKGITLAPDMGMNIGPFFGYSLLFLGYNLQLNHIYVGNTKKEFDISLYSSMIGLDVFYRRNASNFKIRSVSLGDGFNTSKLHDIEFSNFTSNALGFNVYYIFNHRKHSYPAAYNQSTCQKISAGSPIVGFSWSRHSVHIDWESLDNLVSTYLPYTNTKLADEIGFDKVDYLCYSLNGGYSYNFVIMKNLWLGLSLTAGLSYNRSKSKDDDDQFPLLNTIRNFNIRNFAFDGVGRMGLVWNNTRFFAGFSAVAHSYTYSKSQFSSNDIFGNIITYAGFYFGKSRKYRTPEKFFEF